jgi:mRNA interferase MazF
MVSEYRPMQGDIVLVRYLSTLGREDYDERPGLIISNDKLSETSPFVWIVPISRSKYYHPFHINLNHHTKTKGTILLEQQLSIDYFYHKLTFVEKLPLNLLDEALHLLTLIASR